MLKTWFQFLRNGVADAVAKGIADGTARGISAVTGLPVDVSTEGQAALECAPAPAVVANGKPKRGRPRKAAARR